MYLKKQTSVYEIELTKVTITISPEWPAELNIASITIRPMNTKSYLSIGQITRAIIEANATAQQSILNGESSQQTQLGKEGDKDDTKKKVSK
jgi:hypothetical protein